MKTVRTAAGAAVVALGLALAPAAHAAFTSSAGAAAGFSTATVTSPGAATVSVAATCSRSKGTLTLSLTVGPAGALPHANFLRVTISSSTTTIQEQAVTDTVQYPVSAPQGSNKVSLTYEIRGIYRPSGPANFWQSSGALVGSAEC